jgi:raffinose/stachyose/melibiose transport system permease protein
MLFPALLLYSALAVAPTLLSIAYSLFKWEGLRARYWTFNHFVYYHELLHDNVVGIGLKNDARAFILAAVFTLPVALGLGYILARTARGVSFFRAVYFIPSITSLALLGLVFRLFLTQDSGLNGLLRGVGLGGLVRQWLSDFGLAPWVVNFPAAWMGVGFWVVIFIAAIKGIDQQLFDAAAVDGAKGWRQLRDVVLPQIRPILLFAYVLNLVLSLQAAAFQLVIPFPPGSPLNLTHTLASYTYNLVLNQGLEGGSATNWGYASALSVVIFALSAVGALLIWLVNRWRSA